MMLYELTKKFVGDQVHIFFDESDYDKRDKCNPDIIIYNTSKSKFDIDKFLLENPSIGQRSIKLFDCANHTIHVLID